MFLQNSKYILILLVIFNSGYTYNITKPLRIKTNYNCQLLSTPQILEMVDTVTLPVSIIQSTLFLAIR